MKNVFYLLLLILCFSSCRSPLELEGVWIGAYSNDHSGHKYSISTLNMLMEFEGDTLYTKVFPQQGEEGIVEKVKFRIRGNRLLIRGIQMSNLGIPKIISANQDSLVFRYGTWNNKTDVVFKKIRQTTSPKEISLVNKTYSFRSPYYTDSIDFMNDSTFLHIGNRFKNYHADYWTIDHYKDMTFLIIGRFNPPPILVKSIDKGIIHSDFYYTKIMDVELRELKDSVNNSSLYGSWSENARFKEDHTPKTLPPTPPGMDETDCKMNLEIKKDTIIIHQYTRTRKLFWEPNKTYKFIYFPYLKYRDSTIWEILTVSDNKLILQIPVRFSSMNEMEIIEFKRE